MSTRIPTTPKSGCWILLSNGHNRFMVGDIKQSIYRFRQADPQIFNDKFKAYQEEGAKGRLILLKENFRSHVEVLDATNDVFRHLMDEEVGEIDYNQTHYLVAGSDKQRMALPQHRAEFLLYDGSQDQEEKAEDEEAASGARDHFQGRNSPSHQRNFTPPSGGKSAL